MMNSEPILDFNSNLDRNSGYQSGGYQAHGYGCRQSISGAGTNPWQTNHFSDGYQENIFEQNFGDTPYSESTAKPNPRLRGYGKGFGYQQQPERTFSAPELEL
ncbi:hypothetical protein ACN4EG_12140 [Alkalinema pantanalense CENA528]|uniref:hypothetical protein n=1 Tax=Alkalinema pantanalense TaxID=1620705 RepID=UPI003D6F84D8